MVSEQEIRERLRRLGLHPSERMIPSIVMSVDHLLADPLARGPRWRRKADISDTELRGIYDGIQKSNWGEDEDSGDGDVPVREPWDPSPSPLRSSIELPEPD